MCVHALCLCVHVCGHVCLHVLSAFEQVHVSLKYADQVVLSSITQDIFQVSSYCSSVKNTCSMISCGKRHFSCVFSVFPVIPCQAGVHTASRNMDANGRYF